MAPRIVQRLGATLAPIKQQPSPLIDEDVINEDVYADSVTQFPFLNGYTHMIYGFQIPNEVAREEIILRLRHALQALIEQIPWLGGQMLQTAGGEGRSDIFKPAPWPASLPPRQMLQVKEYDVELPSMKQILEASAPMSILDAKLLTPWPSLPEPHGLAGPLPALNFQANFVQGGLLLNLSLHHMAIDGTGMMQIMKLLSILLSGGTLPTDEVEQANRDRRKVVTLIPRNEPVKDHAYLRKPQNYVATKPLSTPQWCQFSVPLSNLPALRKEASSGTTLTSDNDILCAFCWQRISAIRVARGVPADTLVKFSRAIDGRGAVNIPSSYLGHLIHHSIAQLPLGQVANSPLSTVTQALRRALNAANTPWSFRSYATVIAREHDKSKLVFGGLRDVNVDLGATSAVASAGDEAAYTDVFGAMGKILFVRRPTVSPLIGTITITPQEEGALPLTLCLPQVDMDAIKEDAEWKKYTRCIG